MADNAHEYRYLKTVLLALCFVGLIALLGALRDFRHDFDESRDDTRCLLNELNDHRHNNYKADLRTAIQVGVEVDDLTPPPTLPSGPEWDEACAGILGGGE